MIGVHINGRFAPPGVEDSDADICCMGAVMHGAAGCICWEPIYDLEQQPLANGGVPPDEIPTRSKCCGDCAYRNGSPERTEGGDQEVDVLGFAINPRAEFWCHQGVRRAIAYRHPDGREVRAGDGDYQPPHGPRERPVVWKADGAVGERCAGWAAHNGRRVVSDNAGKPARRIGPLGAEVIGPPACPIMHRWTLLRVRGCKLLVHHFLPGSEDMSVHDHPSPFWTFVLWGGYDDLVRCPSCAGAGRTLAGGRSTLCTCTDGLSFITGGDLVGDRMRAGMLRRRTAEHAHRTRTLPQGAWTIVWMGRKERPWGFWKDGRWWPWRDHEKAFGFGMRCPDVGGDG